MIIFMQYYPAAGHNPHVTVLKPVASILSGKETQPISYLPTFTESKQSFSYLHSFTESTSHFHICENNSQFHTCLLSRKATSIFIFAYRKVNEKQLSHFSYFSYLPIVRKTNQPFSCLPTVRETNQPFSCLPTVQKTNQPFYFIPSGESSAYLKQIKGILSAVKKYRIFSLVTDTIFIFSL